MRFCLGSLSSRFRKFPSRLETPARALWRYSFDMNGITACIATRHDMRSLAPSRSQSHASATHARGASQAFLNQLCYHHHPRRHRFCSAIGAHYCDRTHSTSTMSHEHIGQETLDAVQKADQGHLLAGWEKLTADQRAGLTSDIQVNALRSKRFSRQRLIMPVARHLHTPFLFCRRLTWHTSTVVTRPARR